MNIKSNYRDTEKEQFKLEVINEDDEKYYVRLLPEYQSQFQERDKIHPLRNCLYSIISGDTHEQLTLF